MPKYFTKEEVRTAVSQMQQLRRELKSGAKLRYRPENCPLNLIGVSSSHHELSQMIFSDGCWKWTCGYCGEKAQE